MQVANRSIKNQPLPPCSCENGINNRIITIGKARKLSSSIMAESNNNDNDRISKKHQKGDKKKKSTNDNSNKNNDSKKNSREKLLEKVILLNKKIHRNENQLSNDLTALKAQEIHSQNRQDKYLKAIRENKKSARESAMQNYTNRIDSNTNVIQILKKDMKLQKKELKKLNKMFENVCKKNAQNIGSRSSANEAVNTQEALWSTVCTNESLLNQRSKAKEENAELIKSLKKYQKVCNKEANDRKVIQKYLDKIDQYVEEKCHNEELKSKTKKLTTECRSRARKAIRGVLKEQQQQTEEETKQR